ncbi:MAG: hypothetical protein NXI22_18615, partial [bacterium]|nr:hypothetical protein [bacterium]
MKRLTGFVAIAMAFWANGLFAQEQDALQADDVGYREIVQPFLKQHCLACHGPETQEGEFRVDMHSPNDFLNAGAQSKWGEVVNVLNSHEMPPE